MHRCLRTYIALFIAFCDQFATEEFAPLFDSPLIAGRVIDLRLLNGELRHHGVLVAFRLAAEFEQARQVGVLIWPRQAPQDALPEIAPNENFLGREPGHVYSKASDRLVHEDFIGLRRHLYH